MDNIVVTAPAVPQVSIGVDNMIRNGAWYAHGGYLPTSQSYQYIGQAQSAASRLIDYKVPFDIEEVKVVAKRLTRGVGTVRLTTPVGIIAGIGVDYFIERHGQAFMQGVLTQMANNGIFLDALGLVVTDEKVKELVQAPGAISGEGDEQIIHAEGAPVPAISDDGTTATKVTATAGQTDIIIEYGSTAPATEEETKRIAEIAGYIVPPTPPKWDPQEGRPVGVPIPGFDNLEPEFDSFADWAHAYGFAPRLFPVDQPAPSQWIYPDIGWGWADLRGYGTVPTYSPDWFPYNWRYGSTYAPQADQKIAQAYAKAVQDGYLSEIDRNELEEYLRLIGVSPNLLPRTALGMTSYEKLWQILSQTTIPLRLPNYTPTDYPVEMPEVNIGVDVVVNPAGNPTIRLRLRQNPNRRNNPRPRTRLRPRENRLDKGRKSVYNAGYMALLGFLNKTYGTLSEIDDARQVIEKNIYLQTKEGYVKLSALSPEAKRKALQAVARGDRKFYIMMDDLFADLIAEELGDRAIGWMKRKEKEVFQEVLDEWNIAQLPSTTARMVSKLSSDAEWLNSWKED